MFKEEVLELTKDLEGKKTQTEGGREAEGGREGEADVTHAPGCVDETKEC